MRKIIFTISLVAVMAFSQDICETVAVTKAGKPAAKEQALKALAMDIASQIDYSSKTVTTVNGDEGNRKNKTVVSIQSSLKGEGVIDTWFADSLKSCISMKAIAKPHLNSLKNLVRILKEQTKKANDCKDINETYKSIEELEIILDRWAQEGGEVQKEYEALKKEYKSDGKAGVYLEIKEDIFGQKSNVIRSKIKEELSSHNCRIVEQNRCQLNGDYTLKINATACNHKNDGTFDYCSSCLKIDLLDSRNEIVTSPSVTSKVGWDDKETACKKAFEQSASEIYSKIKDNISEVCK